MTLEYDRFDPAPCGFPRPRVPVLPPLTRDQLGPPRAEPTNARRHFARGRYALCAAYRLAGVGPGTVLLAPSYHCRTMLDPALRLGAEVALYPLTPELHADLGGLARTAAACHGRPAALLLTHYFGLPREVATVAAWCRERDITMIEDCSHSLPEADNGKAERPALGRTGRWAVSSPYKFFACPDGGWLWANDGAPLPTSPASSPGLVDELRGLITAWRQWRKPMPAPRTHDLGRELAALGSVVDRRGRDWRQRAEGLSDEYNAADESRTGLAVSRWIERRTDVGRLVERRRSRYRQWVDATSGLAGLRPLFPDLPSGVAPYMFPLLVDDPPALFYPLKQLGMPVWRWDDMAISSCKVATRYRQGVLHLPCHQALGDAQMAWMTTALRTSWGSGRPQGTRVILGEREAHH